MELKWSYPGGQNLLVIQREKKRQANYSLPESLIRDIKVEAAQQSVRPADVVAQAVRIYLKEIALERTGSSKNR